MWPSIILTAGLASLPLTYAAIHEQLAALPAGWSQSSTPSGDQTITLSIGLQSQNIDQLSSLLANISTPGSADYGKYMDNTEVNAFFAPSSESTKAVSSWLTSAGISHVAAGDSVHFSTTIDSANTLLGAKFVNYKNTAGTTKLRTTQYSVPDDLVEHIDIITPTTFFGKTQTEKTHLQLGKRATKRLSRRVAPRSVARKALAKRYETPAQINATCLLHNVTGYTTIGPDCLKLIYNVTYSPSATSGSKIGFGSFLNQSAQYLDLFTYEQTFGIPFQNFSVVLINGGQNVQSNSSAEEDNIEEADLDVQNIIGISHPLPVTEFITGGSPPFIPNLDEPVVNENEPYLQYYNYLLAQPNSDLPQVISNSYGDDEQTVPERYAKRVCNKIGMTGLRGISILESSGDTGVGSPCQSNDGLKTPQFTPEFPATCPYVTGVGGTQSLEPEIAWTGSSGGFSNYFGRPFYQEPMVDHYLSDEISAAVKTYYTPYTNFSNRGFPDVAAHSLTPDFQVIYDTIPSPSGGTSAASPLWAGIIGMINDARLSAGQPQLGFLNPWLYSVGYKGLNDITMGGSIGCNGVDDQTGMNVTGASIIPYATWNATAGWDPVTGLGTPNLGLLIPIALNS